MSFIPTRGTKSSRRKATPHARRKRPNQGFYNSMKWRRIAKRVEREQPICEECEKKGLITDATGRKGVTDHKFTLNEALRLFEKGSISIYTFNQYAYGRANLQRLCNRCHNSKSGREAHQKSSE